MRSIFATFAQSQNQNIEMSSCLAQPNILSCDVRTLCFRSFNPWSEVRCLIRSHNPEEIASHSCGRICDGTSMPIGSGFLIMPQYLHQRRPTCLNGITCSLLLVVLESLCREVDVSSFTLCICSFKIFQKNLYFKWRSVEAT